MIGALLLNGCRSPSSPTLSRPAPTALPTSPAITSQPPAPKTPVTTVSPSSPETPPMPSVQTSAQPADTATISPPLADAKSRITKKPFGIYITPKTSPVQPERFTGYHTGVDFETLPSEQNIDVPFMAICDGPLLIKKQAQGYGGVLVQQCTITGQPVTVIYGHIRLTSVTVTKGDQIAAGTQLGVLGTGFSTETDGERKHLHLGIHLGKAINILGYVQKQSDLTQWLDAAPLLLH